MKTCALCSTELKFLNTPAFGAGKLKDEGELCSKCFMKVSKVGAPKKFTLAEIQFLLQQKETTETQQKQARAAEQKMQKDEEKQQKREQKLADMKAVLDQKAEEDNQKKAKLEEIKEKIKGLKLDNMSSFLGRKEINELPNILAPNEEIDNIVQGFYNNGQGILVSTNRRLVFIDKGLLYGIKVEDFPLDRISSIQYETGLMFGKITIHTSANIASIEQVDKKAARQFCEFVREKLSRPKEAIVVVQQVAQPSVLEQIEKLAQLKEKGILSEEEFTEQKKKLLEKL